MVYLSISLAAYPSGDEGGILLVQMICARFQRLEEGGGGVSTM